MLHNVDSSIVNRDTHNPSMESTNPCSLAVAIGIIVAFGGIFLLLAYYQILPQGINSISNLGELGSIAAWVTLILGATVLVIGVLRKLRNTSPDSPRDLREYLEHVFTVMPEIKDPMRYPVFIACEPSQRRTYIQNMSEAEFYHLCSYLFQDPSGKDLVEASDAILADLRAYPSWETFARSKGAPENWIQAIKKATPSYRDK
jgi:hypothetical protein